MDLSTAPRDDHDMVESHFPLEKRPAREDRDKILALDGKKKVSKPPLHCIFSQRQNIVGREPRLCSRAPSATSRAILRPQSLPCISHACPSLLDRVDCSNTGLFDPCRAHLPPLPSATPGGDIMAENGPNASLEPGDRVVIGITFGNSNSSIAYTVDDKAEVIANEDGGALFRA